MGKIRQKIVTRQTVINYIVFADMLEKCFADITYIAVPTVGVSFKNGRRIVQRPDQSDLGDIELFRCLQQNITGNAFISQFGGYLFSNFLSATVRAS